jgi:valyl-tRNA synthetase
VEPMPKSYDPTAVEAALYEAWLAADFFAPDGAGSRADPTLQPFVIVQPPPNVTGALHLGHALTATIEDTLVRQARMGGRPTLWLPGKDHASIAAQVVLDRILAAEGESRESLGRERYLERMWRFIDETAGVISDQHRRLGVSADWGRERFTMDPVSARAVRSAFKRLYDDGLAYRIEALITWCPGCRTSISDLEVVPTPEHGTLWTVRYPLLGADGRPEAGAWVTVATTRPETMLGDTAVAVHPEDERYRDLVGRRARIPFVDRDVPIVADDVVDRTFGTGAVKITPAHDQDDYETGKRHELPMVTVLDDQARISGTGTAYDGLDRFEARRRIVADLAERGDLIATEPHEMLIGRCQRSDDVLEPRLKTQWFVHMRPLAEKALAAVREGRTRILPRRFEKVFFAWLENIRDWNVSRQLWWGHRIPAWYCPDGHVTVSEAEGGPDACASCRRPRSELIQDEDIFDTWFSSGLWPFSTLGWPERTNDLARYYPGAVMETGYDIIFFWVARMMMLAEWLTGQAPFGTVYLHGMVRDPYGQKMSKTKGNSVDPLAVVDELGADALRFALLDGIAPGADQRLSRPKLEGARNFGNKLWNAARFVVGARPEDVPGDLPLALPPAAALGPAERWILARCGATIRSVTAAYEAFQLGEATRLLHEAIWSEYCDWFIELAKARLTPETAAAERAATWQTLAWVLERYLRLLHPVMPFLTEAVWARLPHSLEDPGLLAQAAWPSADRELALGDPAEAERVDRLLALVRAIRNARAEAGSEPGAWLRARLVLPEPAMRATYESLGGPLSRLAHLRPVTVISSIGSAEGGPSARTSPPRLLVSSGAEEAELVAAVADMDRERARRERELEGLRSRLAAAERRLADAGFLQGAPAEIVERTRRQAGDLRVEIERAVRRQTG